MKKETIGIILMLPLLLCFIGLIAVLLIAPVILLFKGEFFDGIMMGIFEYGMLGWVLLEN